MTNYRLDSNKDRIYSIVVQNFIKIYDKEIETEVYKLIETIFDYPYLRSISFKGSGTLEFLKMFIRIAGAEYLKIYNCEQPYGVWGNQEPPQFSLNSVLPESSSSVKRIFNRYPELVDWSIRNFPQLTDLEFDCIVTPKQLLDILSNLKLLENLKLIFDIEKNEESFNKWLNNSYIEEIPDIVPNLIDKFNSNTTIKSLTVTKFKVGGYNTNFLLTDKFYQSLLSPSPSPLSTLSINPPDNPTFYDVIRNSNCNIKSLEIINDPMSKYDPRLIQELENNHTIKFLSIWIPENAHETLLEFIKKNTTLQGLKKKDME
eukprot:gene6723-8333_t